MTPRERAALDAAIRADAHVYSMGGPDGRIFVETGPFEDLHDAIESLEAERQDPTCKCGHLRSEHDLPGCMHELPNKRFCPCGMFTSLTVEEDTDGR